jgi:mRNA interferase MazF
VVARGDIWLTTLDPTRGSEIRKTRPCIIVSPSDLHDGLRTAIVAPMTTQGRPAPYRIDIDFQGKPGRVLLDQVRTVDKSRCVKRLGAVDAIKLEEILAGLREIFEP